MTVEIQTEEDTTWWCLKAGRGGVLEDDWLDRNIVTTGWGDSAGDFRSVDPETFRDSDPSHNNQLSKFIGHHSDGMEENDIVIAYAPGKGHLTGVGKVGDIRYDEDQTFRYLSEQEAEEAKVADHYYWRPVSWFDWGTPVSVTDLSKRYQVNGSDQIPTPMTLNQYGSLATDRDRIETLVKEISETETVDISGDAFGPERESQIQEWVANNIRTLGLYNPEREVRTEAGRVDILAESENGETVIEIKYGRAGDRALGQLLGYVGVKSADQSQSVDGILIAESFTSRIKHAVSALDHISLYELDVSTTLHQV
ncbi:endonuclease NucS domain-containing protein [Halorubrum aethiopicum]|uniref:endonuclease NucS domain-containing protein n=1 Tax=Halorubrum aethiopicum TaxID=1758255 RepID=UPI000AFA4DD7|nr:endonuclease NucS domain-containing protein [Halorubrum aethiopicum]